jgi:aspartokinase/homoserine dehydrogenase 1
VVRENCVCGFSTIDNIALLNVEGSGMIGVPGIAHRLFGALKAANISVMFIAQASSEHSICFAIKQQSVVIAKSAVEEAFFYELKNRLIEGVKVITECSIIAAVGEAMGNMPGVSGIFFGALGSASISVLSISQGCDERNISAVVYSKDAGKALRAVHTAFLLSSQCLSIGIIGTGRVGSAVIQTLLEQFSVLEDRFGLVVSIRGLANSTKMVLDENLITKFQAKMKTYADSASGFSDSSDHSRRRPSPLVSQESYKALNSLLGNGDSVPVDLTAFAEHIRGSATPHSIIIDCTNSGAIAELHPSWLNSGSHIVTANKRGLASSLDLYNQIYAAVRAHNRLYMAEVTIGASIPVMTTLSDILCSGDQVHSIVGLASVSAGMIFTDICEGGFSFTKAISRTYSQGLFEEDVFRDLEGTESAQKLLILARELGVPMQLSDVKIEPIATRRDIDRWDSFGGAFAEEDTIFAKRAAAAASRGCTLRYVQRIDCTPAATLGNKKGKIHAVASVKVEEVPLDSPLAMVKGAVYHFAFHTERYQRNPLIVQGPLSDSANAASGIVGDILRIARSVGVKDRGQGVLGLSGI